MPASSIARLVDLVHATYRVGNQVPEAGGRRQPPAWIPGLGVTENRVESEMVELSDEDELALTPDDVGPIPYGPESPDVLAYYLPFHFYQTRWGIYLRARGIRGMTQRIQGKARSRGLERQRIATRAARQILLLHETFHHLTELAITRFEAVSFAVNPLHLDAPYVTYFYGQEVSEMEEALCNAFALRCLRSSAGLLPPASRTRMSARLAQEMRKQPAGYREFGKFLTNDRFRRGQDALFNRLKSNFNLARPLGSGDGLLEGRKHFVERSRPPECKVYLVLEKNSGIRVLKPFPKGYGMQAFVHTHDHPPPHFHLDMPPGRPYGRFLWPSLKPMNSDRALSGRDMKALRAYIASHQPQMYRRIKKAYPDVNLADIED